MTEKTSQKTNKKVTKAQILRSVASSSAIETNASIKSIEIKLKAKDGKYSHLTLA